MEQCRSLAVKLKYYKNISPPRIRWAADVWTQPQRSARAQSLVRGHNLSALPFAWVLKSSAGVLWLGLLHYSDWWVTVIKFIFWTLCGRLLYGSLFLPLNKKLKKVIATFYLTILTFFLAISTLQEKSQTNSEKKTSELWDKSRYYLFYFLFSSGNGLPYYWEPGYKNKRAWVLQTSVLFEWFCLEFD